MAIRETKVSDTHDGVRFKEHQLAHQLLDGLEGIEIGAGAHNSFGLSGSINVSPGDDLDVFRQAEVKCCGGYAEIDVICDGAELKKFFPKNSKKYVISSHAFEHFPDPIEALISWVDVIEPGGYIFMIVPKRDALESDKNRSLSTWEDWQRCHDLKVTVDNWNELFQDNQVARRGHYHVYTPDSLAELVGRFDQAYGAELHISGLDLVVREDTDTKVGNGFTLVFKVNKLDPDPGAGTSGGSTEEISTSVVDQSPETERDELDGQYKESNISESGNSAGILDVAARQAFDTFVEKNQPPSNISEFVAKHESPRKNRKARN